MLSLKFTKLFGFASAQRLWQQTTFFFSFRWSELHESNDVVLWFIYADRPFISKSPFNSLMVCLVFLRYTLLLEYFPFGKSAFGKTYFKFSYVSNEKDLIYIHSVQMFYTIDQLQIDMSIKRSSNEKLKPLGLIAI